jgi:predicted nucleotidyltransferase component of viral defense system
MRALLENILREEVDDLSRRNRTREYLQARILLALQDHGAFSNWAFVGGTALRFLFGIPRYSEDLDFSLLAPGEDARFERMIEGVRSDLAAEAYLVEVKASAKKTVASAFVKFRGLLFELGLSVRKDETLSIRVEIDTNPPEGARVETRIVRHFILLNLLHHDRASLLAGKLHAVLSRPYTKGRDLYDLAWHLSDPSCPEPNIVLLDNALRQTGWQNPPVTERTWRQRIAEKLDSVDWKLARADVSPFLERKQDVNMVSEPVLLPLLLGDSG